MSLAESEVASGRATAPATPARRFGILAVKLAVVLWAADAGLRCLAWQFVMSYRDPPGLELYSDVRCIYPFLICLPALFSRRLTAVSGAGLAGCAAWAAVLIYRSNGFGLGALFTHGELVEIVTHPGLSAVVLLAVAWYERGALRSPAG